jgi:7,8-dihydroneopterin aldolase/epimerase/oxygenase
MAADDDDLNNGGDAYDDDEDAVETVVTVEVTGLSIFAAVGVSDAEREVGTRILLDLRMDVGECDATVTDMVEDTVDYGKVCQTAWLVAQERPYKTLERLCSVIADRILADFPVEYVWVKAAKPEPPIPLPVGEVSVEVSREASDDD